MTTTFIPVPGYTPLDKCCVADGRLFLATETRLCAFGMKDGGLLWETSHATPAPDFYHVPRQIRAAGKILCHGEESLLHLFDSETDVVVRCHDETNGRVRWERRVPTPPPLPWTEPAPACEGAETEEISAFLSRPFPAVAVARTSRRATHVLPGQRTIQAPPYQANWRSSR